jgi:hypothetical protein
MMDVGDEVMFNMRIKRRAEMMLKGIIEDVDMSDKIKEIDSFLEGQIVIRNYFGGNGMQIQGLKKFERMCGFLNQSKITSDARGMVVVSFYESLSMLKKQIRKSQKFKR